MAEKRYYAGRPFQYTDALDLDAGQVLELAGTKNDEKLVRLGHFKLVAGKPRLAECGECQALFIDEGYRDSHGRRRHPRRRLRGIGDLPIGLSPEETQRIAEGAQVGGEDDDPDEKRWDEENPLQFQNAAAARR